MRSLPVAVAVGLAMGVVTSVVQGYLPPSSSWTTEIVDAIPFAFIAVFLIYDLIRRGSIADLARVGGPVDAAITPQGESRLAGTPPSVIDQGTLGSVIRYGPPGALLVVAALLPVLLDGFWVGLVAQAFAFGIFFLSYTLVTGEGGMIWLCQITFAGIGALTASQLATVHGWPVLAAVAMGGLVALPIGLIVGLLTIRLGDLYVALVTLTFGLLVEQLVFTLPRFQNFGQGVNMGRPAFAQSNTAVAYLCLAGFVIVSFFVWNLRQSSTGLALNAVRWSEPASRTLGVNVVRMKVMVAGIGALVAGIGGGLLAVAQNTAQPANFSTFIGVFWLAVLVTIGVRSNSAALIAGLALALIPAVLQSFAPEWTVELPPLLFGLGAIGVAKAPDGSLAELEHAVRRFLVRRLSSPPPAPVLDPVVLAAETPTRSVGS
jgi:branched-chain amino acid transport system permease protein